MRVRTVDAAVGKWVGILKHLGIEESYLRDKHGPCPLCGGSDRFRFDDKDGRGTWYCNQCGAGDGMRLAIEFTGLDFKAAAAQIDEIVGNVEIQAVKQKPKQDPLVRLKRIARGAKPVDGINPVRLYLRSRGLRPTRKIKYRPAMAYYEKGYPTRYFPAMICLFQSPEGKPITYHATYLTEKGEKAPVSAVKKIMPPNGEMAGGAIRLTDIYEHIGLAEGVETALAVTEMYGLPCWATATAAMLESFEPPEGVSRVTVFGDNDENFAGQKSAYVAANKLALRGVAVDVCIPHQRGSDFADSWLASFKKGADHEA